MKNNRTAFSLKLILGFPFVGIVWTGIIYTSSDAETLNFNIAYWIGSIGILLGLFCLLSKSIFQIIWKLWHKLILIIDTAITWLTLPLFFYLIFSPFAVLLRASGKAQMKSPRKDKESFWEDYAQTKSLKQYLRQF